MCSSDLLEKCFDNGTVQIITIDEEGIPLLVDGHRLKIYKKPLSRVEFINSISREVYVMGNFVVSPKKEKKKKKRSMGENLSEAPKASLWVENLDGGSSLSLKKKKKRKEKENKDPWVKTFLGCPRQVYGLKTSMEAAHSL